MYSWVDEGRKDRCSCRSFLMNKIPTEFFFFFLETIKHRFAKQCGLLFVV